MKTSILKAVAGSSVSLLAVMLAAPAAAQTIPPPGGQPDVIETPAGGDTSPGAQSGTTSGPSAEGNVAPGEIVVTAQRRAQSLQNVPIAVSAFTAEALEAQQIDNASDLQLSLPNITFTKTNFTASSFTIRGIGDLCTGGTCDAATGIHVNDMPLISTRLSETEYFDLERVEVLRGPQGTLFGRNATSGVVNFITARPNLNDIELSAQAEYGNYDSIRLQGVVNLPITDWAGIRVAGYYLNRDGFTENLFTGNNIDGRDLYAIRGTLRIQPSADTTLDIMGYYFRENDDRSRIQKQLCNRDPTGVLGCLPDRLAFGTPNGNSTLSAVLSSREFLNFAVGTIPGIGPFGNVFGLGSLYGPDTYQGVANPADLRQVRIDHEPTYFADELQLMGRLEQRLGDNFSITVTGGYTQTEVDSTTDFNLAVQNSYLNNPGLIGLATVAALPGAVFGGNNPFTPAARTLIPNGPGGGVCQSAPVPGTGVFAGNALCGATSRDVDRSNAQTEQYSIEAHLDSDFDGPINFLIGGLYLDYQFSNNGYYVTSFGLDYASALLGAATALGQRAAGNAAFPNVYGALPYFLSDTQEVNLRSYGLFGEVYWDISDRLKLTLGLRYNNDRKDVRARSVFLSDTQSRLLRNAGGQLLRDAEGRTINVTTGASQTALVPYGGTRLEDALNYAQLDYDPFRDGIQPFAESEVNFDDFTGRAVLEYELTPRNRIYASFSRGYKSGGINPPLSPVFEVPQSFAPEQVNAFEIGSRNDFLDGALRLNLTGFFYQYKRLQLSRIVARTAVNDNIDANIWGLEAEAVVRPTPELIINMSASYLNTEVTSDRFLGNPQDPSGGRSDAVIIKDILNASNCAIRPVGPLAGNAAAVNAFVGAVNGALGLRAPTPVPGTTTTGAFSVCGILAAAAAGSVGSFNPALAALQAPLNAAFGGTGGPLPFVVDPSGVLVNINGNELPQAPNYKFAVGAQYTVQLGGGMTLVPRADLSYTGGYYGSIFNRNVNRIQGFEVLNAQVQLNGRDDRWFVRAFVQNLTGNDAITGLYVGDASSGLFTNAFTLDPRRYGIAAGVRF